MRSLSIGATGMLAQQLNVDVISNNIANMTTTGFKRQRAEFQDLLYQSMRRVGTASSDAGTIIPAGVQIGAGVQSASVYRIHQQGNMQVTDNPLDVAISGRGFFQVELPGGDTGYTRAGSFLLNAEGTIVTADGYPVIGPGTVPANAIQIAINESGEVSVTLDGQVDPQLVGQFQMANFANEAGLEAIGNNLFLETPASGDAVTGTPQSDGFGYIEQGMLETSNVNIVSEITNLISAQRAYEMNSKVITTTDEMMRTTTSLR
ncbi:MAG: flagellar basal-body rod protein FlgG [Rhodospirillaceae bacterium]|nr:flagellar basal-body rod protein FlgG [Rhodospirillaceae bacterium]